MAGDPAEVYVVVTEPFAIGAPGTKVILSTGEWAACGECMANLEAGEYDSILDRWFGRVGSSVGVPKEVVRPHTLALWQRAWNNRTSTRQATYADRLKMIAELDKFRRETPDRKLP
jgi:hypothetical protein